MKVDVDVSGLERLRATLQQAREELPSIISEELQTFGDESVEHLKVSILDRQLGLPEKHRPNGGPPLVDSRKYIDGYVAEVDGKHMGIYSAGQNDHMSNVALGEVLEYGNGPGIPPRPHIRPLFLWMQSRASVLGSRIAGRIFGRGR